MREARVDTMRARGPRDTWRSRGRKAILASARVFCPPVCFSKEIFYLAGTAYASAIFLVIFCSIWNWRAMQATKFFNGWIATICWASCCASHTQKAQTIEINYCTENALFIPHGLRPACRSCRSLNIWSTDLLFLSRTWVISSMQWRVVLEY